MTFQPAPFRAPLRAFAALVFPWQGEKVLVCNIEGRGWCIPSGRVEPNENSADAARREALEEGGIVLGDLDYLGCYQITERSEIRWADCYVADIAEMAEITVPEESKGRQFVTLDELPELYHQWSPLMKMIFEHSHEVINRRRK